MIIVMACGGVVLLLIVGVVSYYCCCRKNSENLTIKPEDGEVQEVSNEKYDPNKI